MEPLRGESSELETNRALSVGEKKDAIGDMFQNIFMNILDEATKHNKKSDSDETLNKALAKVNKEKNKRIDDENEDEETSTNDRMKKIEEFLRDGGQNELVINGIITSIYQMGKDFMERFSINLTWEIFPLLLATSFFYGNIYLTILVISTFTLDNYQRMTKYFMEGELQKIISILPLIYIGGKTMVIISLTKALLELLKDRRLHTRKINYLLVFSLAYYYKNFLDIN